MARGSEWHIWDLHVHTPFSVMNNYYGDPEKEETWENYVSALERTTREKGIVALGITDYFTIDGYKKLLEYKTKERLKDIVLIPNIEFRVDYFVGKDAKRLNLHVLLSPDLPTTKIEEKFLHDLDFVREGHPFEPLTTNKLKTPNIIELGEQLQKEQKEFKQLTAKVVGFTNAVVKAAQIKELLENPPFKGNYLLVLAGENLSDMDWKSQDHATKKQLIQMAHAIFSSNENDRNFGLGKLHNSPKEFIDEFKSLKPCLWGSDCHSTKERFLQPDKNRYCWIKGEATWEGIRQVLFEPEHRVSIGEKKPEPNKSIYTIDQVDITSTNINENISVENFQTEFNHNLVAVIGGRGSGKTALLDLIASCFQEGEKLVPMTSSFYHRLYSDNSSRKPNLPIEISLGFKSKEPFKKSVGADSSFFDKVNIIYLPQNHFEEYSADPDKLNSHIIELVFEKQIDAKIEFNSIKESIFETEQQLQKVNLEIEQSINDIIGEKEKIENNKKLKLGEKSDFVTRLQEVEKEQGEKSEKISLLTTELESLKSQKRIADNSLSRISACDSFLSESDIQYAEYAKQINELLTSLQIPKETKLIPEKITEIPDIKSLLAQNTAWLSNLNVQIERATSSKIIEIEALEGNSKTR